MLFTWNVDVPMLGEAVTSEVFGLEFALMRHMNLTGTSYTLQGFHSWLLRNSW